MLSVQFDNQLIEETIKEEIKQRLASIQINQVFWDMKTLCKVTCMSDNFIKEQFFFDKRFPKRRVGKKWLFPAKETEEFLLTWLNEKPSN